MLAVFIKARHEFNKPGRQETNPPVSCVNHLLLQKGGRTNNLTSNQLTKCSKLKSKIHQGGQVYTSALDMSPLAKGELKGD